MLEGVPTGWLRVGYTEFYRYFLISPIGWAISCRGFVVENFLG
jgi:hypothetical protein